MNYLSASVMRVSMKVYSDWIEFKLRRAKVATVQEMPTAAIIRLVLICIKILF
jgi:hypothetical protein